MPKNINNRIFDILYKSIVKVKNKREAEAFVNDLLTPTEKIMIAKRVAIAVLLRKGYGYRPIRKILNVSFPTIASVNVSLKFIGKGYAKVIDKILMEETVEEFLVKALEQVADLGRAGGGAGGRGWQDVKRRIQKSRSKKPF